MKLLRTGKRVGAGFALVLAGLLVTSSVTAQSITGQWNFEDGDQTAAIGADGSYWFRPFDVSRNTADETEFGSSSDFGLPDIDGEVAQVMKFPQNSPSMGYEMYPEIDANGGGTQVNEFTIIMDILFPAEANDTTRALVQNNDCNEDSAEFGVSDSNQIGVGAAPGGTILPNTWHRVVWAVDLDIGGTLAEGRNHIDGTLVAVEQAPGLLDSYFSLYTKEQDRPVLLFADDTNETQAGFVSSIQIRDYQMTDVEVAALGGPSADGIPNGIGVTGLWHFRAGDLSATVGRDLQYFDPGRCQCSQSLSTETQFGPASTFGVGPINERDPRVMRWVNTIPCTGYLFPHGAAPNGGTTQNRVNQYSIIMDIYIKESEYAALTTQPPFDNSWIALCQAAPLNDDDAMFWIAGDGGIGDDGQYGQTGPADPIVWDNWYRVAVVMDTGADRMSKYINGQVYGEQGGDGVDGKRALWTRASDVGEDVLLMFTDESSETKIGYLSSLQVRDYAMSDEEIAELGAPSSRGIGVPEIPAIPRQPGDFDDDGDVDEDDLALWELCHAGQGPTILYLDGEENLLLSQACLDEVATLDIETFRRQDGTVMFDFDGDFDTDQVDFGGVQACLSGEDVPGDRDCADAFNGE